MTERTRRDLDELSNLDAVIREATDKKQSILNQCAHEDFEVVIKETFAFDFTPVRQCVVCRGTVHGITALERRQAVTDYFEEFDIELSPEEVEERLNGWNQ